MKHTLILTALMLAPSLAPAATDIASHPGHRSDEALVLPRTQGTEPLDPAIAVNFKGALEAYGSGDYVMARSLWEQLADAGYGPAQHNLGVMFEHGRGGAINYTKAALWYAKAGNAEVPAALTNLARLHLDGLGVTKDLAKAIQLFEAAAQLDYPPAQYNLGIAYLKGRGVETDTEEAAEWFDAAAEAGYAPAHCRQRHPSGERQMGVEKRHIEGEGADCRSRPAAGHLE